MKTPSNILKQNIFLLLVIIANFSHSQNPFIENKGQFPNQVKAKVGLPSGSLFIEDAKLTYAFYSGEQLAQIHDLERKNKSINAHAYTVEFIGKSKKINTELIEQSIFFDLPINSTVYACASIDLFFRSKS